MIEIKQYNLDDAAKWNELVTISKQAHFFSIATIWTIPLIGLPTVRFL